MDKPRVEDIRLERSMASNKVSIVTDWSDDWHRVIEVQFPWGAKEVSDALLLLARLIVDDEAIRLKAKEDDKMACGQHGISRGHEDHFCFNCVNLVDGYRSPECEKCKVGRGCRFERKPPISVKSKAKRCWICGNKLYGGKNYPMVIDGHTRDLHKECAERYKREKDISDNAYGMKY
jgi:hypothetical protein